HLRRVLLAVDLGVPVGAHVALHRADRAIRVGDGLPLGDLTDEHLAVLREGDDRRRRARALGVGDDHRVTGFEHADDGVGGTEIDSDGLGHGGLTLLCGPGGGPTDICGWRGRCGPISSAYGTHAETAPLMTPRSVAKLSVSLSG